MRQADQGGGTFASSTETPAATTTNTGFQSGECNNVTDADIAKAVGSATFTKVVDSDAGVGEIQFTPDGQSLVYVTRTIDTYAATPGDVTTSIGGLPAAGQHTVVITVPGTHSASSTGGVWQGTTGSPPWTASSHWRRASRRSASATGGAITPMPPGPGRNRPGPRSAQRPK